MRRALALRAAAGSHDVPTPGPMCRIPSLMLVEELGVLVRRTLAAAIPAHISAPPSPYIHCS